MANNNFPISSLDQAGIATNLQNWMAGNPYWKDYNFKGSGISSLINFLSYNTSYIGFYVKMLLDESYVGSAHTTDALKAIAQSQGYLPRSTTSASTEVTLQVTFAAADDPSNHLVIIPAGTTFQSNNNTQDQRVFNTLDGIVIQKNRVVNDDGSVTYTSDPFFIYEGSQQSQQFIVDSSEDNQQFVINDVNIDTTTIRVTVTDGAVTTQFNPVSSLFDATPTSNVFYTTTSIGGNYQIYFGQNVFGTQPQNQDTVTVTWLSSAGATGNGAAVFNFNTPVGFYPNASVTVTATSMSGGGEAPETLSDMKFNIPNAWRRQNRLVTVSDYEGLLASRFSNIDSLNVWGGEDNIPIEYGAVFICVKPVGSNALTQSMKDQITSTLLQPYGMVVTQVKWRDPAFINVDVNLTAMVDLRQTSDSLPTIQSAITSLIQNYNSNTLNHFNVSLSDFAMIDYVMSARPELTTAYDTKSLSMDTTVIYQNTGNNIAYFSNPLVPGSIVSSAFSYGGDTVTLADDGAGQLWIMLDGAKMIQTASGSVNYQTGEVDFTLPQYATVPGYTNTTGVVTLTASPAIPDINTAQNNIVNINNINVVLEVQQ